jgi:hypothetical protein
MIAMMETAGASLWHRVWSQKSASKISWEDFGGILLSNRETKDHMKRSFALPTDARVALDKLLLLWLNAQVTWLTSVPRLPDQPFGILV